MALDLTQLTADGTALYQTGFSDGVASVTSPVGDVTEAQEAIDIAAAVASAVASANSQIAALQLAESAEDSVLATVLSLSQQITAAISPPPSA